MATVATEPAGSASAGVSAHGGRPPVLEIQGLTKVFQRRHKPRVTAVDNFSLTLGAGEIVGLLGPNGAGKTTTIKCCLGLIRPTSGRVTIAGHDVERDYGRAIAHVSAVLEGARNVYWRMTPRENVRFFIGLHGLGGREHLAYGDWLLERFGLSDRANDPVMNLSTGMKQKVAVVCALAKRTELVFLDEPTLGLDVEISLELRALLKEMAREGKRTIAVLSHDMGVIQDIAQRVIIVKAGRVVADDTVENLLALFRTRAYHLTLSDGLSEDYVRELAGIVDDLEVKQRGGAGGGATPGPAAPGGTAPAAPGQAANPDSSAGTELTFSLPAAERLYEVIDLVRRAGAVIESISQKEPDLEEAFLRIIRAGRTGGEAA